MIGNLQIPNVFIPVIFCFILSEIQIILLKHCYYTHACVFSIPFSAWHAMKTILNFINWDLFLNGFIEALSRSFSRACLPSFACQLTSLCGHGAIHSSPQNTMEQWGHTLTFIMLLPTYINSQGLTLTISHLPFHNWVNFIYLFSQTSSNRMQWGLPQH